MQAVLPQQLCFSADQLRLAFLGRSDCEPLRSKLAHINLWRGRLELSLRYAAEATEIQRALGTVPYTYPLHAVQIFQIRNQRTEAQDTLQALAELVPQIPMYEPLVALFTARLALDAEEFDRAALDADRAYAMAVRIGVPFLDVTARTVNSRLRRLTGFPAAAVE